MFKFIQESMFLYIYNLQERVLRTNKRYPLEKYIHLIISPVRIVELKLSFKHIMFGNKCERQ